jgi:hypothetical protein
MPGAGAGWASSPRQYPRFGDRRIRIFLGRDGRTMTTARLSTGRQDGSHEKVSTACHL